MCFWIKKKTNKVFIEPDIINDVEEYEDVCPICLDKYNNDIINLKCNHIFHENCIKKWYEKSLLCPVCREDTDNLNHSLIRYKFLLNTLIELDNITESDANHQIHIFENNIISINR